jgi:5-oxoprolinase (ATP-hydrolysing)/N-methylhydantoinase A
MRPEITADFAARRGMADATERRYTARPNPAMTARRRSGDTMSATTMKNALDRLSARYRIGVDIGGTFTDFVLLDAARGQIRLHKRLTTPSDPSEGALLGLDELVAAEGIALAEVGELLHGTTLVTNAIIERRGAKVGLLTTKGFRDILEMGIEQRYDIYDLFLRFPTPLVDRRHIVEIGERIAHDGRVIAALDPAEVRGAAQALAADGVEAIAVCFLHCYANREHEQSAGRLLRSAFPALSVSLSSEVVPELREYERATTTTANAYVQPLFDRYIGRLEGELRRRGFAGALYLMQSSGGLAAPDQARRFPVRLLESGPAGGGLATALFGKRAGKRDVISFDMGGTTAKTCLVQGGAIDVAARMEAARVHRFKKGSGLPIKAPVIDMIEIGAGGGSIASIDEVGLLKVGPHSAGADPGPACYGRGGTQPTVTDANLLLGYLDPNFFLGGRMTLDRAAAESALATVAAPLGLTPVATAAGIFEIVSESMAGAARVHLIEKGRDPRRYALVGFGGAGPAHAAAVARNLGIAEVIVPPASGAASALGFLAAPLGVELSRSATAVLTAASDYAAINAILAELEAEGRQRLAESGVPAREIKVRRFAEMRLLGQMHEITVPVPEGELGAARFAEVRAAFVDTYAKHYTHVFSGAEIEAIGWRVRVEGATPEVSLKLVTASSNVVARQKGSRPAYFDGGFRDTPVYDRYALRPGDRVAGPAIIEEHEATTVVPPDDALVVDDALNLRIEIGAPKVAPLRVTADMPRAEAIRRIESDKVGLEIMWARLVTVVEEMWQTVCRTAFSLVISEAQDFACELLDANGEPLAHSPRAMPVFNLCLPKAVKAVLAKFPPHSLRPGDVLVTNDPWLCAGHLYDIAIVTPVFRGARLVGMVGTVGHVSDIGGTRDTLRAREIYEEGIQIPPMKLYRAGQPSEDFFTLFAENVRNPQQVLGDLHALITANAIGAERLLEFMTDYGLDDLSALAEIVQSRSEKAMREAIRAIPSGVYESTVSNRPLNAEFTYKIRIEVKGDEIKVDFPEVPAQLPQGGINCTLNYTQAHVTYPLKCMLTPNVRGNAGCYRPFTVSAPAGSILNCDKPRAVNYRTRTGWYISPNLFKALAPAAPKAVQAYTGLPVAMYFYGYDKAGRLYSDHLFMGGGQGGSAGQDGKSALLYPTSAANTSVELFEARCPILVVEKSFVQDSGGAGTRRGGLGQVVRVAKLDDDGLPALVTVYPEGVGIDQAGLFGGAAGGAVRGARLDRDGAVIEDFGSGNIVSLGKADEIIELHLGGGSGYGSPLERPIDAVANDVEQGYVSRAGARDSYGCVVDASGRIDAAASTRRRAALRHAAE